MNPQSNWHKRSDHAKKKRERYLLSTFRSIRQSLSGSTHSMSSIHLQMLQDNSRYNTWVQCRKKDLFAVLGIQGDINDTRLLPRVRVLIVARLPFFRHVGFVTPLDTCIPDIIRNSVIIDVTRSIASLSSCSTIIFLGIN